MKHPALAGAAVAAAVMLGGISAPARTQPADAPMRAPEIAHALKGKVCTSRIGSTFAFERDGHYAYDGLWTDHGHYRVDDGAITILLDSGLEKHFAISRRNGILFLENTAVSCT